MKNFIATMFLVALSTVALADDNGSSITIAADSSSGTYAKMLGEIIGVCSDDNFNISQARGVTGGAPGNLDALVNNKAQAAFLHSDVYFANAQADSSYAKFQTLVALYPEPIHVFALTESKTSKTETFSFGKAQFNSLADVRGYKVGAAGGGVYTARILQGQGEGGFQVVAYDSGDQVIAALKNGDIAAAIFVGAAPLPNVAKFARGEIKLLPIGESIASRVSGVYRTVTINYPGITNGPLKTLAPVATLLTRKYSTPAKVLAQKHFRDCFLSHIAELQDNGSPNWQQVDANDHGVLPWYDIPTVTSVKK